MQKRARAIALLPDIHAAAKMFNDAAGTIARARQRATTTRQGQVLVCAARPRKCAAIRESGINSPRACGGELGAQATARRRRVAATMATPSWNERLWPPPGNHPHTILLMVRWRQSSGAVVLSLVPWRLPRTSGRRRLNPTTSTTAQAKKMNRGQQWTRDDAAAGCLASR